MMVAVTPGGCPSFRDRNPASLRLRGGRDSPNLLNREFRWHVFADQPRRLASRSFDREAIAAWDGTGAVVADGLLGDDLIFVVKKNPEAGRA